MMSGGAEAMVTWDSNWTGAATTFCVTTLSLPPPSPFTRTVSVAATLVALPAKFLATAEYIPASVVWTLAITKTKFVAPATAFLPLYH